MSPLSNSPDAVSTSADRDSSRRFSEFPTNTHKFFYLHFEAFCTEWLSSLADRPSLEAFALRVDWIQQSRQTLCRLPVVCGKALLIIGGGAALTNGIAALG